MGVGLVSGGGMVMLSANVLESGMHTLVALFHVIGDERVNVNTLSALVMQQGKRGGIFGVYLQDAGMHDVHPVLDWAFVELVESADIRYERDKTHVRASARILGIEGAKELQTFSAEEQEQIRTLAGSIQGRRALHPTPAGD